MLLFIVLVTAIISILEYSVHYLATLERKDIFDRRLKGRANYNTQLYNRCMGDSALAILNLR